MKTLKYNTTDIILKFKNIHKNTYDYSLVDYKGIKHKVSIICPIHGEFEQTPEKHIYRKHGCEKCGLIRKREKKTSNTKEFISKSKKVHGNLYDYSLVNYKKARIIIKIICSIHGEFEQTPNDHLNGNGCPKCNESKGEKKIRLLLEKKDINFFSQKRFKNCKYKNPLPFDFYLPEYNMCIEFDGEQHFRENKQWGGKEALKLQKVKDEIKNDFCIKNKINLIRIRYNENINLILQKHILIK